MIIEDGKNLIIKDVSNFEPDQVFDCGQAFRWVKAVDGSWTGIVGRKKLRVSKQGNDIILFNTTFKEFNDIWKRYFDIDRDYGSIIQTISSDPTLKAAAEFGGGIRILVQDPWETICSFIISQNNNIPRIKGIIDKLCTNFGECIDDYYTFPSAEKVSKLTLEELSVIKSGFRAKYILDAAQKIASNQIDLSKLYDCDIAEAREELMKIKGVGPKVCDCALLFAFARIEAFPIDVWIKRALNEMFGGELPEVANGYAGIVQQYIFHYARNNSDK